MNAQLPAAPVESAIDPTVQLVVTSIMACFALAALITSLVYWARSGKPTIFMLFISGGAMMVMEPFVDLVGCCWHPANGWHVFTAYGRPMPLWLCLVYFFYFGIGVGVTWILMKRGLSRAQLWGMFVANMLGDIVLEVTLLHFDTYYYYGGQPLVFMKFPLWWAAANGLITMVAATIVYRHEQYLRGWRQLLILPISWTCYVGAAAVTSWPSWLVINTDTSWPVMQLGGIATFALACWFMSLVVTMVEKPASN